MTTPHDPTSEVPPVDPVTGYSVPQDAPAYAGTATAVAPAPAVAAPTAALAWYRQPWGVALIVVAALGALLLSFVAGFATRSALDRAFVRDRIVGSYEDGMRGQGQRGPGMMGDRDGDRGMGPGMYPGQGPGPGQGYPGQGPGYPAASPAPTAAPTPTG